MDWLLYYLALPIMPLNPLEIAVPSMGQPNHYLHVSILLSKLAKGAHDVL